MSLEIEPEVGVPFSDKVPSIDLRTRVEAASNTASMLAEHGLEVEPTAEDNNIAAKLTLAYADDPEKVLSDTGVLQQFLHRVGAAV